MTKIDLMSSGDNGGEPRRLTEGDWVAGDKKTRIVTMDDGCALGTFSNQKNFQMLPNSMMMITSPDAKPWTMHARQ